MRNSRAVASQPSLLSQIFSQALISRIPERILAAASGVLPRQSPEFVNPV
jgi:hypothetical protein